MQIVIIKHDNLKKYSFPNDNISTYWLKDLDDNYNERDLISIEKKDGSWFLLSNETCSVEAIGGGILKEAPLKINEFYNLKILEGNDTISTALLQVYKDNDMSFKSYCVTADGDYTIGSGNDQNIILRNSFISPQHAIIRKSNGVFTIQALDEKYGIFVNKNKATIHELENGDVVYILGYTLFILNEFIFISNYNGELKINSDKILAKSLPTFNGECLSTEEDDAASIYTENDYFSRQPRFVTSIVEENLRIDNPPAKQNEDDTPIILTIGPMLTMTMSSAVSVSTSLINLSNGKSDFSKVWPSLLIAVAMIASTILWPSLSKKLTKKRQAKGELERQRKYHDYLSEKRNKINSAKHNQHQILIENFPDPKDLKNIIVNRRRNLWERQRNSGDFLNVRLGVGTIPLRMNIQYAEEEFTMAEDALKSDLTNVAESAKEIPGAPVIIDLAERNKLVLIGESNCKKMMIKNIMLQLATYHAYNDLKFVFMLNDDNDEMWEAFKLLPHSWSDARDIRFYANNYDDMSKLSFYLEQVFTSRKFDGDGSERQIDYRSVQPYYLIIVDNIKKAKNLEIIDKILKEPNNLGFGLIILNDGISNLPNECTNFLTADERNAAIITNDLNKNNQQTFTMDKFEGINLPLMCEKLSNIPIKSNNVFNDLATSLGFLEMYKVGKVEQLNVLDKWIKSNPVNSLSVPIGVRSDGETFTLDLHEKFHGPHGLIAGMTGSGKSEFIITFILSMCLNFNPEEVSFVLIDYKGGGLTGAFENPLKGIRLPHLAGTITNLDKAEIKRSLSSIQSELKRRQALFNKAKLELNESTLDIYKYQQLYRDGVIKEPISHLFIISDEFAELKSQQSEFMQELISTARIGRSLGVHLILATQKPSGIVDDQIWSNSKFKVCLKVQERSDSMDVIKCPDAVTLKKAGRFYLQVGYNDFFAMGQSAYAGTKYIPKDHIAKTVNRDISFINNIGDTVKSMETIKRAELVSVGEELPSILKYICDAAASKNLIAKKLWLDKIPAEIFVNNLMKKYNFNATPWEIKAVLGELDDPNNQRQDLLQLDFTNDSNTLIYGATGKEIMLTSMIYSLIINHTAEEINIYILDFGNEMFNIFINAPQVGDVVFVNEEEKLVNLFNTINKELEKRKKLFAEYNGSYNLYIKSAEKKLPRIIIVISNYEGLSENYEDYINIISSLSREGEKYGITFVITATGANAVRGKTSQNFSNVYCLQFNDESDYSAVLGPTHGMIPSAIEGRGLVKEEGELYEFQAAYPCKWDQVNIFIKDICSQLASKLSKKVDTIAVLPDHVRLENVERAITSIAAVPVGIYKKTLEICTFNFNKSPISIISAQDSSFLDKFTGSIGQVLSKLVNTKVYMIDPNEVVKEKDIYAGYYGSNAIEVVPILENTKINDDTMNVFVIYGIEGFMNLMNTDLQRKVKSLFTNLKSVKNIKIIIIDAVNKVKAYEYEEFYRVCVQPINAVWIGSGITDQFTIKSSTYTKETRANIESDFGYFVDRGTANLIKVLDFYTED